MANTGLAKVYRLSSYIKWDLAIFVKEQCTHPFTQFNMSLNSFFLKLRLCYVSESKHQENFFPSTQGINESTNVRFLQRLSVIYGFRRDCPWSRFLPRLPSTKNGFLQRLSVWFCFLPRLCRKLFTKYNSLGRKQKITDSLGGSQIWRTVSAGSENWRTHLYPVLNTHKGHKWPRPLIKWPITAHLTVLPW